MPNHVTHRVVVTGPEGGLQKFREGYIVRDTLDRGDLEHPEILDFNRVIPMPEALEGTSSGSADMYHEVWFGSDQQISIIFTHSWVKEKGITTREGLQQLFLERDPEAKTKAELMEKNLKTYGAMNWYDWSIAHWGTKWNSYSLRWVTQAKDRLEFRFETAWSVPIPVFYKLSEELPDLKFSVFSFDEGSMFAGIGNFKGGENNFEIVDASDEIYELVYGVAADKNEESND